MREEVEAAEGVPSGPPAPPAVALGRGGVGEGVDADEPLPPAANVPLGAGEAVTMDEGVTSATVALLRGVPVIVPAGVVLGLPASVPVANVPGESVVQGVGVSVAWAAVALRRGVGVAAPTEAVAAPTLLTVGRKDAVSPSDSVPAALKESDAPALPVARSAVVEWVAVGHPCRDAEPPTPPVPLGEEEAEAQLEVVGLGSGEAEAVTAPPLPVPLALAGAEGVPPPPLLALPVPLALAAGLPEARPVSLPPPVLLPKMLCVGAREREAVPVPPTPGDPVLPPAREALPLGVLVPAPPLALPQLLPLPLPAVALGEATALPVTAALLRDVVVGTEGEALWETEARGAVGVATRPLGEGVGESLGRGEVLPPPALPVAPAAQLGVREGVGEPVGACGECEAEGLLLSVPCSAVPVAEAQPVPGRGGVGVEKAVAVAARAGEGVVEGVEVPAAAPFPREGEGAPVLEAQLLAMGVGEANCGEGVWDSVAPVLPVPPVLPLPHAEPLVDTLLGTVGVGEPLPLRTAVADCVAAVLPVTVPEPCTVALGGSESEVVGEVVTREDAVLVSVALMLPPPASEAVAPALPVTAARVDEGESVGAGDGLPPPALPLGRTVGVWEAEGQGEEEGLSEAASVEKAEREEEGEAGGVRVRMGEAVLAALALGVGLRRVEALDEAVMALEGKVDAEPGALVPLPSLCVAEVRAEGLAGPALLLPLPLASNALLPVTVGVAPKVPVLAAVGVGGAEGSDVGVALRQAVPLPAVPVGLGAAVAEGGALTLPGSGVGVGPRDCVVAPECDPPGPALLELLGDVLPSAPLPVAPAEGVPGSESVGVDVAQARALVLAPRGEGVALSEPLDMGCEVVGEGEAVAPMP